MELGYCGLNCSECAVYLASVDRNEEKQIALAKEYSTGTYRFTKEDMFCLGCHSDTLSEKMCGDCEIRKCGQEKPYGNCAECDGFPCPVLVNHLGPDSDNMDNLKQLAIQYKKQK